MSVPDPATTAWLPLWDTGASGGAFGSIPGEIKMWGGKTLPDPTKYGKWVWADGASYVSATYPEASANIATEWKTAHGAADPGAGNFRVPDLRGVVPMPLDQMPGGTRANRTTRAAAITVASKVGEEYHTLATTEMPSHAHTGATGTWSADHTHTVTTGTESADHSHTVASHYHGGNTGYISNDHSHQIPSFQSSGGWANAMNADAPNSYAINSGGVSANHYHAITAEAPGTGGRSAAHTHSGTTSGASANHTHSVTAEGGGGAHENLPPTIFVPYIVRLDGNV